MKTSTLLILCAAAFFVLAAALAALLLRRNARVKRLTESAEQYLRTGEPTPVCLREDRLAALQNAVADLQTRLELEKQRTARSLAESAAFTAEVSHQLKTPLAGIRLYCEMLAAEDPTGYTEKELQLIEKTERLVAGLLRYQRIRTDGAAFAPEACRLEQLAQSAIGELRPLFPQKQILLSGGAAARCDRQWMTEAIGNVVKNACEHTAPAGTVRIGIEESDGVASLCVSDDGGGVPEAQLPFLFDRFFKAGNAAPASTGLGLAVTKAVAEKHHGAVSAVNGEKGLTVTICLPQFDGSRKL